MKHGPTSKTRRVSVLSHEETELEKWCATFLAGKLLDLKEKHSYKESRARPEKPTSGFMNTLQGIVCLTPARQRELVREQTTPDKPSSAVAEPMMPQVAMMTEEGVLSRGVPCKAASPAAKVGTYNWNVWFQAQSRQDEVLAAKAAVMNLAARMAHNTPMPSVALTAVAGKVKVQATKNIRAYEVKLPLYFTKPGSIVSVEAREVLPPHPHCVVVTVNRPPTAQEKDAGMEEELVSVDLAVTPEFKLSSQPAATSFSASDALSLFWAVTRQTSEKDECNCIMKYQPATVVAACDWANLIGGPTDSASLAEGLSVSMPVIVNDKDITAGKPLVLKWTHAQPKQKATKKTTWVDTAMREDKKRRLNKN